MALNDDQKRRLAVGGTTAIPSPFPSSGTISYEDKDAAEKVVKVTQEKTASHANVWLINLADVNAIQVEVKDENGNLLDPGWHVGATAIAAAIDKSIDDKETLTGIAYVPGPTAVLLRLEHGLSAGVSAEVAQIAGTLLPADRATDEEFGPQCWPRCPPKC